MKDYRAFIFAFHEKHGLLLLHCTRKKEKGPHFQIPGGHVDDFEFKAAEKIHSEDREKKLIHAARLAATRELYEETGINVQKELERVTPVSLRDTAVAAKEVYCEIKERLYFSLNVTDNDFFSKSKLADDNYKTKGYVTPMGKDDSDIMLKISVEHSGFTFEPNLAKAANMIEKHSGGNGKRALQLYLQRNRNHDGALAEPGAPSNIRINVKNMYDDDENEGSKKNGNKSDRGLFKCFFC